MPERIHFLAGLPRSGSTLLGSLLAQNEAVHVTPTSPLFPLLVHANEQLNLLDTQYTFDKLAVGNRLYRSLAEAVHADAPRPIVIDKHRGWPKHVEAIRAFVDPEPRIIAPVRPIGEVITSYLVLADQDSANFIDTHLKKLGVNITNEARADLLWREYLKVPYEALQVGLATHRESILLVDYRELAHRPLKVLGHVAEWLDLPAWRPNIERVANYCAEDKDAAWGLRGLHDIRPRVSLTSANPLAYLPRPALDYFAQFDVRAIA